MTYMDGDRPPLLMIVGGDNQSWNQVQTMQHLTEDLDIEERVRFIGSVAQSKLPVYYSASDVCAIPSYYESFGMVALESLACGTPIVATNVGGLQDIIRNNRTGRIVPDNSPHRLASEITALFNRTENEEYIRDCLDAAAIFSWKNIAAKILGVYYRLLQPTAKASMIISSSN
jgi:D-inositol-3-phosphate glycosyltransferase